ncbi:universal stress protein [Mangrovicoccus sp. HB161399]|uniref:universal stress protein n=1 Tax=Mangrovicoccus sp. HB161399 TaxID=2720392 RepID=UPI001554D81A|nr:universal stress protein [Mangrovicoccus sp. HB161399]
MKTILAGSDLSPRSARARQRAQALAAAHGATLVLCCVIDADLPPALSARLLEDARRELERQGRDLPPCRTELRVERGAPAGTLLAAIAETGPDLVVLGTHRPRPVWDMVSGTTAERIVRATGRPVLLVSRPAGAPYRSVLCGIDLSKACAAAARWAAELAPEARFSSFHALQLPLRGRPAPDRDAAELAPFLEDARARIDHWWLEEALPRQLPRPEPRALPVEDALAEAMDAAAPDLVAVGAHARTAAVPGLLGSFARALVRSPPADLLILRG